jgi:hypothetical protein
MVFPSRTLLGEGASLNGLLSPDGAAVFPLAAAPYTFSPPPGCSGARFAAA